MEIILCCHVTQPNTGTPRDFCGGVLLGGKKLGVMLVAYFRFEKRHIRGLFKMLNVRRLKNNRQIRKLTLI